MKSSYLAAAALALLMLPASLTAQVRTDRWDVEVVPTAVPDIHVQTTQTSELPATAAVRARGGHPLLRTVATLAAATAGYALADEYMERGEGDVRYAPIAAGAGAAAVAGIAFSSGNPLKIIIGSALSTLPSAALSTFLAGSLKDDEEGQIPLIAFSIPQGLLTSAFAQDRP